MLVFANLFKTIEFIAIGLFPVPNFKRIESLLILTTNLGLKRQRY